MSTKRHQYIYAQGEDVFYNASGRTFWGHSRGWLSRKRRRITGQKDAILCRADGCTKWSTAQETWNHGPGGPRVMRVHGMALPQKKRD